MNSDIYGGSAEDVMVVVVMASKKKTEPEPQLKIDLLSMKPSY